MASLKLSDVIGTMKSTLLDPAIGPEAKKSKILDLAASFLRQALGRTGERSSAAIFQLEPEHELFRFAYPPHLANGNTVPATGDSLAGKALEGRSPMVWNDVPKEPHKEFFERIPDGSGAVRPIQKMIAAPVLDGNGEVIGVVQVSRTGVDASDAGEDFTPTDATNLDKCCRAFGPFLTRIWATPKSG